MITANMSTAERKFCDEIVASLQKSPKQLPSKYFYDCKGDALFQQIMAMPEYYLTRCELEIFTNHSDALADAILLDGTAFDHIELGAGDATKSALLLTELQSRDVQMTYIPIDISANVLSIVSDKMQLHHRNLDVHCIEGEYLEGLQKAVQRSDRRKLVLFLGSNIGNMEMDEAMQFCTNMRQYLNRGDIAMIGFDLKKHPQIILDAYNDPAGITAAFNLNLLTRINRELSGNFNSDNFEHYATYDPITGACKSYLISLIEQQIAIDDQTIYFDRNEPIYMELSQKYTLEEIETLALATGFKTVSHITDSNRWFADSFWQAL